MFNLLTGISQFQGMRKLLIAPFELHDRMLALIHREAANARKGLPARIIAKMNALVDREIIEALYEASQAGVQIDLIVRGVCSLRPGLHGISETIRVRSIIGRFLEHSRIYYFYNGGEERILVGSADLMPRNLNRRVEVLFPIEDGRLIRRLHDRILMKYLEDEAGARIMQADGTYIRPKRDHGKRALNSQTWFLKRLEG